ncbi:hypothetical protein KKHLCK_12310 [Candidatus Electrothrix laxa]
MIINYGFEKKYKDERLSIIVLFGELFRREVKYNRLNNFQANISYLTAILYGGVSISSAC